ncbi:hypothetical protein [Isoptericola sp. NPDC057559]|uniref:zf-HC2 domain-containing protein n=1 Tax=Isoptericola sp. NPDC057559 TaxID=3346168 RepID=UPI003691CE48
MSASHGDDAPVHHGVADDAIRRIRLVDAASGRGGGPGAAGSADPDVLREALTTLAPDDLRLLRDRYLRRHAAAVLAGAHGIPQRAVPRRLAQAEERLGTALAAAHADGCPPGCRDTRLALEDYAHRRLAPARATALEDHLVGCTGCLRAVVDVRDPAWALRDAGPVLVASGWGPVAPAVPAEPAGPGVQRAGARSAHGRRAWLIAAGTLAAGTVAAVAVALGGGDEPGPAPVPPATTGVARTELPTSPGATPGPGATEPGPSSGATQEVSTDDPSALPTPTDDAAEPDPAETSADPTDDATTKAPEPTTSTPTSPASTPRPTRTTPSTATPTPDRTTEPTTEPSPDPTATAPTTEPTTEPTTPEPTPTDDPTSTTDPPA